MVCESTNHHVFHAALEYDTSSLLLGDGCLFRPMARAILTDWPTYK